MNWAGDWFYIIAMVSGFLGVAGFLIYATESGLAEKRFKPSFIAKLWVISLLLMTLSFATICFRLFVLNHGW